MHNGVHAHAISSFAVAEVFFSVTFLIALVLYLIGIKISNLRFKKWPRYRLTFFIVGIFCALIAVSGPLAQLAHTDFNAHMVAHLLLGMLAPLLLVLSAPMTLLLRATSTRLARRITGLLRSSPIRFLHHPIVASILNIGGLWLLYKTNLYSLMHENLLLHTIIHIHIFLAGYLFTASMIYIDPVSHRKSYQYRSVVLVLAFAAHSILAKMIYAYPPTGITRIQAESGGMLMYYGGDLIDALIIYILCYQWYNAAAPRIPLSQPKYKST
ncbi:cytochrome c oxidase assembly protein [Ornithinibacillus contaminans]|uniref:cytochrome c oxidase assembly protein n=1 Tax=Ornithinibacillus contaminans TaxID=694055 RepID=UPI00064D86BE|nr:cytochrome c oxidase assembly protein [Ornithinibacillus contaminans]